jgi:thioester reductase-like protein
VQGVRNLVDLAATSQAESLLHIFFISTLGTVASFKGGPVSEEELKDPSSVTENGYAEAKWISEKVSLANLGLAGLL